MEETPSLFLTPSCNSSKLDFATCLEHSKEQVLFTDPKYLSINQLAPKFSGPDPATSSFSFQLEKALPLMYDKLLSRITTCFSKSQCTAKYSSAPKPPKAPHSFLLLVVLHSPSYGSTAMTTICTDLFPLASCTSYPKYP